MSKRAFTIVELLVVVAILGMLGALIVPAMERARERGRLAQCANNLKQLHTAAMNVASSSGSFPHATTYEHFENFIWNKKKGWVDWESNTRKYVDFFEGAGYKGRTSITNGSLFAYINDERVYVCPTFLREGKKLIADKKKTFEPVRSYVMNWEMNDKNLFTVTDGSRKMLFCEVSLTYNDSDGARVVYYGTMDLNANPYRSSWTESKYHPSATFRMPPLSADGALTPTRWSGDRPYEGIGGMHSGGKGNAIFADGHLEVLFPTNTLSAAWGNW